MSLVILITGFLSSCNQSKITIDGVKKKIDSSGGSTSKTITVSNVDVTNNQLVIDGVNLDTATSVRVTGPSGFDETFAIESQSNSQLIANSLSNLTMVVNGLFSLIVSNAHGAATYSLTFELQDGQVTAAKLNDMGAVAGEVLTYNGTTWGPAPLTGLSYQGTFDATGGDQTSGAAAAGHYYIVTNAGSNDPDGLNNGNTYTVGDWAVYNGSTSQWDVVIGSNAVVSVAGKVGAVSLSWADFSKAGSLLSEISNVDVSGRVDGDILVWNNTTSNWEVGQRTTDTNTNAITECGAGQVLLGDGSCSTYVSDTNASTICADGQYLDGDGTCYAIPVDTNTTYTAGTGLDLTGTVFSVPAQGITNTMINGVTANCANGEFLEANGTGGFTCVTAPGGTTYSAGAGLDLTGTTFSIPAQGVTNTMISGVTANCGSGEVLKANGSGGFNCATDSVGGGANALNDLSDATTTTDSLYIGTNAGFGFADADNNIGIGVNSLDSITNGGAGQSDENIAIGNDSLDALTTGRSNTVIGHQAATNMVSGTYNTILGWRTGYNSTGSRNVFLGRQAGYNETGDDKLYISNTDTANPLIYGEFNNNLLRVNGNLELSGTGYYLVYRPNGVACNDGEVLKWDGTNSRWSCDTDNAGTGADNLGNHTATQNIDLGTNLLVGNGGSAGVAINASGNVGIGNTNPLSPLHVSGGGRFVGSDLLIYRTNAGGSQVKAFLNLNTPTTGTRLGSFALGDGNEENVELNAIATETHAIGTNYGTAFLIKTTENATTTAVERLRVDHDGKVGIGTTTPAVELDVNTGVINASAICDENNANCLDLSAGVGGTSQWTTTGSDIYFNTGDVGIGNTAPGAGLHLTRKVGSSQSMILEGDTSTTGAPKITFRDSNGGATDADLSFDQASGFSFTGGNLGVGTTAPAVPLQVNGDIALSNEIFFDPSPSDLTNSAKIIGGTNLLNIGQCTNADCSSGQNFMTFKPTEVYTALNFGLDDFTPDAPFELSSNGITGSTPLFMISSNDDTDGDYVTITKDGKIGFGTKTPSENLVVGDDLGVDYTGKRLVVGDTTGYPGVIVGNDDNNRGWQIWDVVNDVYYFGTRVAGTSYNNTLVLDAGKVGVGTASPAVALDVDTGVINASAICDENNANCLDLSAGVGGSDNLGDHTATQNLQLGTNYISNNGTASQGLVFDGNNRATFKPNGGWGVTVDSGNFRILNTAGSWSTGTGQYLNMGIFGGAARIYSKNSSNAYPMEIEASTFKIQNDTKETLTIDSNGNVGVGFSDPTEQLATEGDGVQSTMGMNTYREASSGSKFIFRHSRGSRSAKTASQAGDYSNISFRAYDGSTFGDAAEIRGGSDITATAGSTPGRLRFYTTPSGSTTASERMIIDSSGYVGIRNTNPTSDLVVGESIGAGYAVTADSSTQYGAIVQTRQATPSNAAALWVRTTPDSGTTTNTLFRVENTGNAVFGSSTTNNSGSNSNSKVVSISGDGASTTADGRLELVNPQINANVAAGSSAGRMFFMLPNNGAGGANGIIAQIQAIASGSGGANGFGGDILFGTKADNGAGGATAKMILKNNGFVGINKTNPGSALDVNGTIRAVEICDETGANCSDVSAGLGGSSGDPSYASSASSPNDAVYVNDSGFVGIGTTTPGVALHIKSSEGLRVERTGSAGFLQLESDVANPTGSSVGLLDFIGLDSASNRTAYSSIIGGAESHTDTAENGFLTLRTSKNGTIAERVRVTSDGNVGIGTDTPQYRFHNFASGISTNALFESDTAASAISFKDSGTTTRPQIVSSGDDLYLQTNGSERFRVKSDGKIGIGTSTPDVALDVATGVINASAICDENNTNCLDLSAGISSGDPSYGSSASSPNDAVFVNDSGNVGIGTTSPSQALHVSGQIVADRASNQISINDGSGTPLAAIHGLVSGTTGGALRFRPKNTAGSFQDRMTILETGHVGIGTTTPSQLLQVSGGMARVDKGSTGESLILTGTGSNLQIDHDGSSAVGIRNSGGGGINFKDSTNANVRVHIANSGNVGLGTTSPSSKLEVIDGAVVAKMDPTNKVRSGLMSQNDTNDYVQLEMRASDDAGSFFGTSLAGNGYLRASGTNNPSLLLGTTGTAPIIFGTSDLERMQIDSSGNVGIGRTPASKLDVNGTVRAVELCDEAGANCTDLSAGISGADNLGNHTATQNLDLATFKLVGNGGTNGLVLDNEGNVGVGVASPFNDAFRTVLEVGGTSSGSKIRLSDSDGDYNEMWSDQFGHFNLGINGTVAFVSKGTNNGFGAVNPQSLMHLHNAGIPELQLTNTTTGSQSADGALIKLSSDDLVIQNQEAAGAVKISTAGNANTLYASDAGFVGVGLITPQADLDVTAAVGGGRGIRLSSSADANNVRATIRSSSPNDHGLMELFDNTETLQVSLRSSGDSYIRGGHLGIGTTAPNSTFHVNKTNAASTIAYFDDNQAANNASDVVVEAFRPGYVLTDETTNAHDARMGLDNDSVIFSFDTDNDEAKTANSHYDDKVTMKVQSNGKVAIGGDITPLETLHIYNNAGVEGTNGIFIQDPSAGGTNGGSIYYDDRGGLEGFKVAVSNASTETGYIYLGRDTGRVGIATGSPVSTFHVNDGPAMTGGWRRVATFSALHPAIQLKGSSQENSSAWIELDDATTTAGMSFRVGGTSDDLVTATRAMTIRNSGNVGIGTVAPTALLSVNGTANKPGGGSWATFSDARLKDVTGSFEKGLSSIRELSPIRYNYKEGNGAGIEDTYSQHIGFIAQDVQQVIPEAVSETNIGYLEVNNDPIIWTMFNGIKELDVLFGKEVQKNVAMFERMQGLELKVEENSRAIASLEEKVEVLEEENKALREENAKLEERLKKIEAHLGL